MKITHRIVAVSTLVVTMATLAVSRVNAQTYQSQSQSFSSSSNVTTSCQQGNCGSTWQEVKTHVEGSQSQHQSSGGSTTGNPRYHTRSLTTHWVDQTPDIVAEENDGAVLIKWWDWKGGTCHVRYNEAKQSGYKYSTSTACDNGSITVGGLVPGQKYRFQVKKDGGNWSKAFTAVAQ